MQGINLVNTMLKEKELDYLIGDCGPSVIVTTKELAADPLNLFKKDGAGVRHMVVVGGEEEENIFNYESWWPVLKPWQSTRQRPFTAWPPFIMP